jgi:hypothetical protein
MSRFAFRFVVIAAFVQSGCTYKSRPDKIPTPLRSALESAASLELLSLNPLQPLEAKSDDFHHFRVLGKTSISDPATVRKIVTAFESGVSDYDGVPASCFNPRHGIRIDDGAHRTDLVICFECEQVEVFVDGIGLNDLLISQSPRDVFDDTLKDAGIEPAPARFGDRGPN